MSDSVRPRRRRPTRLPRPWDSPGKNTGVGCHFLLQCMKVKSQSEVAQSCPTLSDLMDCTLIGSSVHGIFPSGVGCHCLLKKINIYNLWGSESWTGESWSGLVNSNVSTCWEGGALQPPQASHLLLRTFLDLTTGISSFGYSFITFNILCNISKPVT